MYLHSHFSSSSPSTPSPFHLLPVSLQSGKAHFFKREGRDFGSTGNRNVPSLYYLQVVFIFSNKIQVRVFSNSTPSTSSSLPFTTLFLSTFLLLTTFVSCVLSLHHPQLLCSFVTSLAWLLCYRCYCESPSAITPLLLPHV